MEQLDSEIQNNNKFMATQQWSSMNDFLKKEYECTEKMISKEVILSIAKNCFIQIALTKIINIFVAVCVKYFLNQHFSVTLAILWPEYTTT